MSTPKANVALRDEAGRQRTVWSLGAALLALALLTPVALAAYGRSTDRARQESIDWAESNLSDALASLRTDEVAPPDNTWEVNPRDGWSNPIGETWTDPPVMALGQSALDGAQVQEFEFNGRWLAMGQYVGDDTVLLTVIDQEPEFSAISRARLFWLAVTLALAGLAAAVTWFATGRARSPIDQAHAVNRHFIADAAHELRTPLSIIQASAGHALSRERSNGEYRESLSEILDATERAGSSVGELLEFARLEAGQAAPRLAPLRIDLLVEEVAASVRIEGVTIEAQPTTAVVVSADYNLLRQMIENLTRNAAARADKVSLSTHMDAKRVRVEIADDGPGFDPGIIDHVFERFRRGDRSGSVGLGMAIAKTIAELHGGGCEATNRQDGGALVTVWLPQG